MHVKAAGFCCIGRRVDSREAATPEIAMVRRCRRPMFKGRHFDQQIIVLCVRWFHDLRRSQPLS
jgi:hypothetical protein